jgi:hypothetical protein
MTDLATTVSRWSGSAGVASQRYQEGIQGTQVDPTALAVAAQGALLANFQAAVQSGHWARRLQAVGRNGWQQAALAKANNYATGFQAGQQKYQQSMQTWLPIIQQAAQQVKSTPALTFQDRLQRSVAFATALHNAKLSM